MHFELKFRHAVFRFRRFTRKRYAAFASVHRVVSIGRVSRHLCDCEMLKAGRKIAVAGLAAAFSIATFATDADPAALTDISQLTLEEVMVVVERAELQSENLRVINTLSAAGIAALPVTSVSDLLDYLPGVDARARGAGGTQTDISIRGGTFDQILILLNGHNITDAQTGHYSLDLPVGIDMIDHIEVLNGTSMSRFGLSAFSGAINIVTKGGSPVETSFHGVSPNQEDSPVETSFHGVSPKQKDSHVETSFHGVSLKQKDSPVETSFHGVSPKQKDSPVETSFHDVSQTSLQNTSSIPYWATISTQAGSYGLFHPALSAGMSSLPDEAEKSTQWSVAGSASYNQSTGYIANTDYRIGDMFFHASAEGQSGKWNTQAAVEYKGMGANSFYSLKYPDQFDATKTAFVSLDWQRSWNRWTVRSAASYRIHHDRFELFRETWKRVEPAEWYTGHNYHLTQNASANIAVSYASSVGNTSAGVEVRNENILSNVLGDIRSDAGSSVYIYTKNRLNVNYFLQQTFYWHSLSASAGVSGNWNTMFLHNMAWSANIAYELPCHLKLYANANQGVRLPTFTDLYYKSATQLANPDLKAEKAITIETGLSWQNTHWSVQTAAWYRWGRNIIDWVLLPDDERWQSRNLTAVNAIGTELQATYRLNEWLRRVSLGYSFCSVDMQADGFQSKYALDYLRHKLVAQVEHRIWKGLGASWNLTWQQREGEYTNREGVVEHYTPVCLFDAKLYWEYMGFCAAIEGNNLFGVRYYDYGGIEQPLQTIRVTVKYKM